MTKTLHLHLKHKWFEQILKGEKTTELRLVDKWPQIATETYHEICLHKSYRPAAPDTRMYFPWNGYKVETITHEEFGPDPVEVFVIALNLGECDHCNEPIHPYQWDWRHEFHQDGCPRSEVDIDEDYDECYCSRPIDTHDHCEAAWQVANYGEVRF